MSNYEEKFKEFTEEMNSIGFHHQEELYHAIIEYMGDAIYDRDASLVACSDKKELEAIKKDFLIGKLGLTDNPKLEESIQKVCELLGTSNRNKHTATFYYMLVALFNKEDVFIKVQPLPVHM